MTTHHDGSLGIDEHGGFRIHFDRTLAHDVDRVWSALVVPERLSVWMPGCRIDAHAGGDVRFDFGDEGVATGRVLSATPPADAQPGELVHTWVWEDAPPSRVTWSVSRTAGGTRLQLTHGELPARDGVVDFTCGWHVIVETLARHLYGAPADDVWDDYERIAAAYAQQLELIDASR